MNRFSIKSYPSLQSRRDLDSIELRRKRAGFWLEGVFAAICGICCAASLSAPISQASPQPPSFARQLPVPTLPRASELPATVAVGLNVVPDSHVVAIEPNHGRYAFGQVCVLDSPRIEQIFVLRNEAKTPLKLTRIQPSCGCTSTFLRSSDADSKSDSGTGQENVATEALPELAPGQHVGLRVVIDLQTLSPGPLHKYVAIYAGGETKPAALLEINGTLLPNIIFSPPSLDFGQVPFGQSRSLPLTVKLDARLLTAGKIPDLVVSNPNAHASLLSASGNSKPESSQPEQPKPATRKMVEQRYQIVLSNSAPIGPITGRIALAPITSTSSNRTAGNLPIRPADLATASAFLSGQVVGDVSAQPPALAFGIVDNLHSTSRTILLIGAPKALSTLKVSSDSPWLTVRAEAVSDAPAAANSGSSTSKSRNIEVTLAQKAPLGVLRAHLTVTLDNGQSLSIPVIAYVLQTPPGSQK